MQANNVSPTLQGVRVALTVAADDPHSPAEHLRQLEADVIHFPVAQLLPPDSYDELDSTLERCSKGEINWLLLISPYAVEAVAERMAHLGIAPTGLSKTNVDLFGAKTGQTFQAHFPDWNPALDHFNTHQQVVDAMQLSADSSVLLPLAMRSRSDWPSLLQATRAEVIAVPAYRLILGRGGDDLPGLLWGGLIDAMVFLTENSVRHFVTRLKAEGGTLDMLDHVTIACLDPQTATAAQVFGLDVHVLPTDYTPAGLARALALHMSAQTQEA